MPKVHVMSVVGSAVPTPLRAIGLLACWYLVQDGERIGGPFLSHGSAHAASLGMRP
ncbi:hypothetical protein [Pseudomonas sp. UBA2684]|uniref:hypothetical protein n=1 Tax=Pseudomonas sp. UBA2684 TaxID=1947311 RepID=UPI0025E85BF3|nr:hypothetical protein [Pseudomonas sp. UBA2684]|tara:strand:- start:739 stop:906 length:168 start_codon:yes stop_codon:yes gene_type:complete